MAGGTLLSSSGGKVARFHFQHALSHSRDCYFSQYSYLPWCGSWQHILRLILQRETEKGMGWRGMHFCEAECDNQAFCQCQKAEREREVSLIAGKTCIPLEFNESGAGVRLCE